jgi:hypothetical protein
LTGQQALGASQALTGQQAFGASQAFSQPQGLQLQRSQVSNSFTFANKSRTGVGRQTFVLPQTGSQAGSQAFTGQQALTCSQGAAQALQLPQPPSVLPSNRSKSSAPNPWLHRAALNTSAPKIVLLFIEQQLLFNELQKAGLSREQWDTDRLHKVLPRGAGGFSHG